MVNRLFLVTILNVFILQNSFAQYIDFQNSRNLWNFDIIKNEQYIAKCDTFEKIVLSAVKTNVDKVSYGLCLIDRKTNNIICEKYVNADKKLYPASSIKTLIAMKILQKIDNGIINFDDKIKINQSNANEDGGGARYSRGKVRTINELLIDMITISNNIATNQLIDIAGKDEINKLAQSLGAYNTKVYRKMYANVPIDTHIKKERNTATAYDYVLIYTEISTGKNNFLSEKSRKYLIDLLSKVDKNDRLNAKFPSYIKFYHKTGSTSNRSSDAGFFYLNNDIIVILVGLQNFCNYGTLSIIGQKILNYLK